MGVSAVQNDEKIVQFLMNTGILAHRVTADAQELEKGCIVPPQLRP
ncbi:hypothetical protein D1BOALGB6SA_9157 [Olavius sp. associated proteobacterium Delta 1]|nr:hypothetical protein D1BOALGB6SA_9157 [Olavius sp. associated proteobacterium Delta 1]